ncbi:ATP-binding protein [Brucella sp. RRSP16]|uniref:ATP-binding protein n=1 Tax=Brucella sp. RRSP16 TaxID=3453707 RepID=UPI003FCE6E97
MGRQAARHDHFVLYVRAPRLFEDLAMARLDGRYPRLMNRLMKIQLLILDDFANVTLPLAHPKCKWLIQARKDAHASRGTALPLRRCHSSYCRRQDQPAVRCRIHYDYTATHNSLTAHYMLRFWIEFHCSSGPMASGKKLGDDPSCS